MELVNRYKVPEGTEYTYIGRGTVWGNPFKVEEGQTREIAAAKYRKYLARNLAARNKKAMEAVRLLQDVKTIACSCAPLECHGECYKEIYDIVDEKNIPISEAIRLWVKVNGFPYGPATDGKDHLNVFTKAKTALGKKLSNMSNLPVYIEGAGQFLSLEGYWYWLSTGKIYPELLDMNGYEAKQFGKYKERVKVDGFEDLIRVALWKRFEQNPTTKEAFTKSTLPLTHYYYFGDDDDRTVTYPPYDWIVQELELLRSLYQGKLKACVLAGSRDITELSEVEEAVIASGFEFDIVVSGGARGVDLLGEEYAKKNGKLIRRFIPDWDTMGKKAGFIRNNEMGQFSNMGIVLIKNQSKGSTQMRNYLKSIGKEVYSRDLP